MEQTLDHVKKLNVDAVFMETTTPSIMADYESLKSLKQAANAVIIVGGPHATYFHREILIECSAIDVVIRHEFDTKISEVVDHLENLENIKGITYRKNDKIIDNEDGVYKSDLDNVPFPDRKTIPWQWYLEAWYSKQPFMNFMTSRGCPWHCAFCLWPQNMYGHRQRFRSLDNVFKELKFLIKEYGLKEINIDDGTFTTNKKRVIEFCRRLRREGIKLIWTCNGRVDTIDDEMLKEMKRSGCKMIRIGVESGSQEVLDKIKKGLKIEQGVKLVKKHGIQALGGFIFGFPYDSKKSIEQTIQLAKKISPDQVQFSIYISYPGTSLYEYIKNNPLKANLKDSKKRFYGIYE